DVERALLGHQRLQAGAFDVLHGQKVQIAVGVDVEGSDDVRMVEGRDSAGLAVEAFAEGRVISQRGRQYFNRRLSLHMRVLAEVDAAHAAGADLLHDLVAAKEEALPFSL